MRLSDKFIAIAEDHPAMRSQLSAFIKFHGFHVLFDAVNGRDFLFQLGHQVFLPHLCILDIDMPELDGYSTARRIKDVWPDVRVILYSVKEDARIVEKAMRS